jgi:hypothetical protein
MWLLSFNGVLVSFLEGDISLRALAENLCQLGVGFVYNNEDQLEPPTEESDLQLNQVVHYILKEKGVLGELRGFFSCDLDLDEDHDLKIAAAGYDENLVQFLQEKPDKVFFEKK